MGGGRLVLSMLRGIYNCDWCFGYDYAAAHIGIGISGREGQQAVLASDYSFGQFRYVWGCYVPVQDKNRILLFFLRTLAPHTWSTSRVLGLKLDVEVPQN